MSSIWGNRLKISLFGESHGPAIGVVVDGFPAGIKIDMEFIEAQMQRRAAGSESYSTRRIEPDKPEIQSGVYNGFSTGSPICAVIKNSESHSKDYESIEFTPRPGHADFTGRVRYGGFNDPRGGGHFSGRLTAPIVFAGALSRLALREKGITIGGHVLRIGDLRDLEFEDINKAELERLTSERFAVIDSSAGQKMKDLISEVSSKLDSIGGIVQCAAIGLKAGIGNPIFDTIEGNIASFMFSIPAVKGVEFGAGFRVAEMLGSRSNDAFRIENGNVETVTNNAGGVFGGISSGMPIVFNVAFKPTPSIYLPQQTVDLNTLIETQIEIKGRHDSCIVPRAVPVVEAGCAIAILDLLDWGRSI